MPAANLFVTALVVFATAVPILVSADNTSFSFLSFAPASLRNLTLLGDSYLRNGFIGLTRDVVVPSSSSGTVIYNRPVSLFDQDSNITASFSTSFEFSVSNVDPTCYGDGLAFFLSPDGGILGSPGGYLGLVNSSQLTKNRFVAVEFDTRLDLLFHDPNENHVGLDLDSLDSIETADPISQDIYLKSGDPITAWIDYENDRKKLFVFLSKSSFKPRTPVLHVDVDLSPYLKESMYVGFSASTEGSTELHSIGNWSFQTFGFLPVRPRSHPHNVSDSYVTDHPPIPLPGSDNKHRRKLGLAFGIAGPAFFCAALSVFGFLTIRKWKRIKRANCFKPEVLAGPREFSYKELNLATRGFHCSRVVGHGAFGTVYKAFFVSSGTIAAVKRCKHSHDGKTEFVAELSIIARLRHKNLVQLQGWCTEKGELLLVYDFMPHGSLDQVLYQDDEKGSLLKWNHRVNIAIGLASVLAYLHQECEQRVIHRDIKTSNIMLDLDFNARLGDFGLARLMDHDKSPVSTLTAGTMGYLAPEYLHYGKATEKTDVFSFGVVILEVACGRRPIEKDQSNQTMVNLVDWVWGLYSQGRIADAADRRLNGDFDEEEMKKLLLLGLSCANPNSTNRPSMRRVLQVLMNEGETIDVPLFKPSLSFSHSLPLSLDDIVCDIDD
ncbi:hypothetical protein MLD38_000901 [Melastoma candidum]|uniref:Uncharacterized protein n=1 Tax=Melastoma candidum TaxID=119954 RepID=A0ACB9SBF1_9MYRT|nr:hypothetical protein MLD38_000901 [Melastoma candidum]